MIRFHDDLDEYASTFRYCNFGLLEVGIPAAIGAGEAIFGGAEALGAGIFGAGEAAAGGLAEGFSGLGGALGFGGEAAAGEALGFSSEGGIGGLFGEAGGALGGAFDSFGGLFGEAGGALGEAGTGGTALGTAEASLPGLTSAAPATATGASTFAAPAGVAGAGDLTSAAAGGLGTDITAPGGFEGLWSNVEGGGMAPFSTGDVSYAALTNPGQGLGSVITGEQSAAALAAEGGQATGGVGAIGQAAGGNVLPASASSTLGGAVPGAEGAFGGVGTLDNLAAGGTMAGNPTSLSAPAASGGGVLDKLGAGVMKSVTANPLGTALAAGGLGYNLLQGQSAPKGTDQLRGQADALASQSAQLRSYLQSGTLPLGLSSAVDAASAAAKARVISNYAGRGLPTDPSKNSSLAQELASIDQNAIMATAQIGQQLLQTGVTESGLANNLYEALIKIDQTQTANTGKSIAAFASALGGGGTKIQIGGTAA